MKEVTVTLEDNIVAHVFIDDDDDEIKAIVESKYEVIVDNVVLTKDSNDI